MRIIRRTHHRGQRAPLAKSDSVSSETEFSEEEKAENWKKVTILVLSAVVIVLFCIISLIASATHISPPEIDPTAKTENTQTIYADYGSGFKKYADR